MNKIPLSFTCKSCNKDFTVYVYEEDYNKFINGKELIQDCFPYLSDGERELFISGLCDDCFNQLFNEEDEEWNDEYLDDMFEHPMKHLDELIDYAQNLKNKYNN